MTPHVAKQAKVLNVFMRTANYVIPAGNTPLSPEESAYDPKVEAWKKAGHYGGPVGVNQNNTGRTYADWTNDGKDDTALRAELDKRWDEGGFYFFAVYVDIAMGPGAEYFS